MKKILTLLFTVFIFNSFLLAQNNADQHELESGTIESQLDYLITKSTSFREFQLIRKQSFLKVKKNVLDSLSSINTHSAEVTALIPPLKSEIVSFEANIVSLKKEIELISLDRDSINVLGKQLDKTAYNTFVWSLVVVLLLALLFFIFQYKNSAGAIKKAKFEVELITNDLEEMKKKTMKKEQELMRKLQDELNKNA